MYSKDAIAKFESYINDWCLFAREYLRVNLDHEQEEILRSVQVNPKTAVSSGTARGKDYVAAVAGICFLYLTPRWDDAGNLVANTKVIMTAPTDRQVKDIMVPEFTRIFQNSIYLPGELSGYNIKTPFKEWFLTGFKADDKNVESWSGYHAANILYIVTEATGLPDPVFNAIEGNLQGNSRLLIVFNPNITTGYAAAAMKSPSFKKFRLNSLNATNVKEKKILIPGQVDYTWVKDRITDWCTIIQPNEFDEVEGDFVFEDVTYRPNDLFRIKILGLFPKVSEGMLVPQEWIELANKRWQESQADNITDAIGNKGSTAQVAKLTKSLRLGVDIAGMGRDNSCFVHRYGNLIEKFDLMQGGGTANHMQVAGTVVNILRTNTNSFSGVYAQAFLDTIGEGAGVYSRLQEVAAERKEIDPRRIHSVKFSAAGEWNELPLKDRTGQYEFLNMRAYLYWAIRDWLNPDSKNNACLPVDDELMQELTETKWKFNSSGRIQLEDKEELKKRIKRSPDKADALANTFYPVPDVDPNPKKRRNVAEFFH